MAGFILWFTGLSGSGKSTLARLTAAELERRGIHTELLDGDEVRTHLSRGLGFSREDRDENIRRVGFVARLVERCGACAITATISPYRATRQEMRASAVRFVEIFVDCPVEILVKRDTKGLYERAMAGELRGFTGVDDPYEEPLAPEVHLFTDRETVSESLAKILVKLEELSLLVASATTVARGAQHPLSMQHPEGVMKRR